MISSDYTHQERLKELGLWDYESDEQDEPAPTCLTSENDARLKDEEFYPIEPSPCVTISFPDGFVEAGLLKVSKLIEEMYYGEDYICPVLSCTLRCTYTHCTYGYCIYSYCTYAHCTYGK